MLAGVVLRRSNRALAAALLAYWALDSLVSRYLRPRYLPPAPGPAPHGPARAAALLVSQGPGGAWSYQPGGRFWTFQFIELAVLVVVAALCTGPDVLADQRVRAAQPDPALAVRLAAWGRSGREAAVALGVFGAAALVLLITGLRMHAGARALLPSVRPAGPAAPGAAAARGVPGRPAGSQGDHPGHRHLRLDPGRDPAAVGTGQLLRLGVPLALGALAVGLIARGGPPRSPATG